MKSFILAASLLAPVAIAAPALAQPLYYDQAPGEIYVTQGRYRVPYYDSQHFGSAGYTGWGDFGWVDPQEVPPNAFSGSPGGSNGF
jgi:hypothetical protein